MLPPDPTEVIIPPTTRGDGTMATPPLDGHCTSYDFVEHYKSSPLSREPGRSRRGQRILEQPKTHQARNHRPAAPTALQRSSMNFDQMTRAIA
jgi:hypothetical protein